VRKGSTGNIVNAMRTHLNLSEDVTTTVMCLSRLASVRERLLTGTEMFRVCGNAFFVLPAFLVLRSICTCAMYMSYVCVYICVCMYMYKHVYMYVYACIYVYVYVCMYIHVYMYVYAYLCIDCESQ